jgi:hypothetical protein
MATITLEVPDKLAEQLEDWTDELPAILSSIVDEEPLPVPQVVWRDHPAWREALEFLAGSPDLQAIVDYKLPQHLQDRLELLLNANSAGDITPGEVRELDGFIQIIRFFNLLKASLRSMLI